MGVAVLLAGDLGGRDLLHQRRGATHHHFGREGQALDAGGEFLHVRQELVGDRPEALGRILLPEAVFDAVKAGEGRVGLGLLVVVGAAVDRDVEVGEQLGNRLDRLVVEAGRREEGLGLFDITCLDRAHKGLGVGHEVVGLLGDIELVLADRADQIERGLCLRGLGGSKGPEGDEGQEAHGELLGICGPVLGSPGQEDDWLELLAGRLVGEGGRRHARDEGAPDIVAGLEAGQGIEIAAADGLEIFLQRFAIEAALDGDK